MHLLRVIHEFEDKESGLLNLDGPYGSAALPGRQPDCANRKKRSDLSRFTSGTSMPLNFLRQV